jgi:hypothetical protein
MVNGSTFSKETASVEAMSRLDGPAKGIMFSENEVRTTPTIASTGSRFEPFEASVSSGN